MTTAVKCWLDRGGGLLRIRLARPKANLIDAEMIDALRRAFAGHRAATGLRGVLLDADGPHFSFGASVPEHLPGRCAAMLSSLHALLVEMLDFGAPILVAVRGQCLGGGLEVALAGSLIFAADDARLGQPEMKLGVLAPAASCLLPYRLSQGAAEDLLLSGRSLAAEEAKALGLVDAVAVDPEAAALAYYDAHLAGKSASSLALALTAVRAPLRAAIRTRLAEVESLYLGPLMQTRDANEGLAAFIERREPEWQHR